MFTRRSALGLFVAAPAALSFSTPAFAATPEIFTRDGLAIGGYDPVAYVMKDAAVEGSEAHSVMWKGAAWRFESAENATLFEATPEDYAPQYGGYCAYAVSKGATAKTEPDAWTLHDGKLYLNFNTQVRSIWREDIPGNVALADANWPSVLDA